MTAGTPTAADDPATGDAVRGPGEVQRRPVDASFWLRTVVGWHIVFWVVLGAAAVSVAFVDFDRGETVFNLALLGALGLAYGLLGQPAASSRDPLRSNLYRVVLVVVVGLLAAYFPNLTVLLYVAYPQVWFLSQRVREGVFFTVALTVAVLLGIFASEDWSTAALLDALPWLLVSLTVSLVLGIWIDQVVAQSEDRAELITELQATRDQLAAAHHASGVVAERERMAREIHDTLAQGFTSIVMLAETAAAQLSRDRADRAAGQLALIESTARDNLAEARALVAAFSPVGLQSGSLPDAMRRLASRFGAETGVDVELRFEPDDASVSRLHATQQVVLLRAAQEALTNVRKHAAATRVTIAIRAEHDAGAIEVHDDGAGFEVAVPATGFGLAGMRTRVEEAGGTVVVSSALGGGTTVRVRLPGQALSPAAVPS